VAVVAVAAQVEHPAAVVDDALDLPEIVHSRARLQGTRPPLRTRATTLTSNASTRGDPGSEGDVSGPYLLVRSPRSSDAPKATANYAATRLRSDFCAFRGFADTQPKRD
jgi:hypothetical protein